KKVKLGPKGKSVDLPAALEVFKKEAGLDVPVRGVADHLMVPPPRAIDSEGEELPVGAWLQLYQDYSNGGVFYVREYGLLFAPKDHAPPDAQTLAQFWKTTPPPAKPEPPKPAPVPAVAGV